MNISSFRPDSVRSGYADPRYAASLAEFGRPSHLPWSDGWLLERPIPESSRQDAIGCYPLFCCGDYTELPRDFDELSGRLVSVGLVPDPLTCCPVSQLQTIFDHVRAFKEHFIVDVHGTSDVDVPKHHRYYARRALRAVAVQRAAEPLAYLDEWVGLYETLVERHQLTGIQAFSPKSFEIQLQLPGLVMLRAIENGVAVGAHLWFLDGERGYSHLMALNPRGYELSASYALYYEAIFRSAELLSEQVKVLNIGGGAGSGPFPQDALSQFKRGWSIDKKSAYFCGKILDRAAYDELLAGRTPREDYFPAYRAPAD